MACFGFPETLMYGNEAIETNMNWVWWLSSSLLQGVHSVFIGLIKVFMRLLWEIGNHGCLQWPDEKQFSTISGEGCGCGFFLQSQGEESIRAKGIDLRIKEEPRFSVRWHMKLRKVEIQ